MDALNKLATPDGDLSDLGEGCNEVGRSIIGEIIARVAAVEWGGKFPDGG